MSGYWRESDVSSADELDDAVIIPEKLLVPWLRAKTVEQNAAAGPTAKPEEPSHECGYRRTRSEWLSGSWPLRQFDESLPTNKRKAEWHRFRDQFERIVSCKSPVDAITRLTGMKIFAGGYLLSIIEMQEKRLWNSEVNGTADWYGTIIAALDKYFNEMCDTTKERMKFREMKMRADEAFADWVLWLDSQSLFCEFTEEQRKEELVQALSQENYTGCRISFTTMLKRLSAMASISITSKRKRTSRVLESQAIHITQRPRRICRNQSGNQ